jgi:hypothetical protein
MTLFNRGAHAHGGPWTRRLAAAVATVGLVIGTLGGFGADPALADTSCDPGSDVCVINPSPVVTPVGVVTVTVSGSGVVTVQLAATSPDTLVVGVPFALPSGLFRGCSGSWSHTAIETAGGEVAIDSLLPPGPPCRSGPVRRALPSLAVISIHPPGPCRVTTVGTTVVFTPVRSLG